MLPSSTMLRWVAGWLCLLACIVLADVFWFTTPAGSEERPRIAPQTVDTDRRLEVSWLGPSYYAGASEGLWVERMLEERFNVELKPIFLDPNGYLRKKPLMIAGGPVPDLIWEADPIGLQKAVEHGFVAEVPLELLAREMPVWYRELTEEAPVAWMYCIVDGRNFGLPTMSREGGRPKPGIWRMDWLRNVGIDRTPETLMEFEEALRRISRDDPDGNGVDDTYGMSGDISNWWWVAFSEIFGAYGVLPFDWQEVDGRIVWGGLRPEAREALALLRRWYAEGLIHPEFVTDSMLPGQTLDRKFFSGKTGYIYYRGEQGNLNETSSGSFAFKFLNLQFAAIAGRSQGVAERLIAEAPDALLMYALSEELMREAEADGLSAATVSWILNTGLQKKLLTHSLYRESGAPPEKFPYPEHPTPEQQRFIDLRAAMVAGLLGRLPEPLYAAFNRDFAGRLAGRLQAQGIDPEGPLDAAARSRVAALMAGDALDGLLEPSWRYLLEAGVIRELPRDTSFNSLIISHYGRLLYNKLIDPVLVPAPFPAGPEGRRGARAWGKGSNIITFGAPVAEKPEVAARMLGMFEEMYTDRVLGRESMSGREGLHWEWVDPVLRENGPSGFVLKRDFVDTETGKVIDLSSGANGMRRLVNNSIGYYNLVGFRRANADYYTGRNGIEYKETWQREEWGLENALGKSDVVPSAAMYLSDLRMRQQTVFAEIIRGSRPLEAFDAFVSEWHAKGGDILLAEANQFNEEKRRILREVRSHLE